MVKDLDLISFVPLNSSLLESSRMKRARSNVQDLYSALAIEYVFACFTQNSIISRRRRMIKYDLDPTGARANYIGEV